MPTATCSRGLQVHVRGPEHLGLLPARGDDHPAEETKKAGHDPKTLKIAIVIENDDFSQDVRDGIIEDAKKYGMQIVIDDKLPADLNDMSATLTKVKALKPDALMISGHEKGAILGCAGGGAKQVYVPMLALTHCDSAQIAEKFGKDSRLRVLRLAVGRQPDLHGSLVRDPTTYASLFKKAYNYDPPYQAAESTASVEVFADAIERAGSLDKEKVRDALARTDMMTFYGPVKFDATGKNVAKSMVMYQVQARASTWWSRRRSGRRQRPVFPAPDVGQARFRRPRSRATRPEAADPLPPRSLPGRRRRGPFPMSNLDVLIDAPVLLLQLLVSGILVGAIFALVAYGMALVWGVMNIINIAQGEFVMLGGYVVFYLDRAGVHPCSAFPSRRR